MGREVCPCLWAEAAHATNGPIYLGQPGKPDGLTKVDFKVLAHVPTNGDCEGDTNIRAPVFPCRPRREPSPVSDKTIATMRNVDPGDRLPYSLHAASPHLEPSETAASSQVAVCPSHRELSPATPQGGVIKDLRLWLGTRPPIFQQRPRPREQDAREGTTYPTLLRTWSASRRPLLARACRQRGVPSGPRPCWWRSHHLRHLRKTHHH